MIKRLLVLLVTGTLFLTCSRNPSEILRKETVSTDLDSIIKRGSLKAVTDFNSANYFVYKGEPMGFNYDLLRAFAGHLGVDLELVAEDNIAKAFDMLNTGDIDLLAMGLTVTPDRRGIIKFAEPIDSTTQVLIQKKPGNWRKLPEGSLDNRLLRRYTDLANKRIYVQKGSVHAARLREIEKEIGKPVSVVEVPFDPEILIQLVDDGEIDYAVCDENIAHLNSTYSPDLDIEMKLSDTQKLAWGMRISGSARLQEELDKWITNFSKTTTFAVLYNKYYRNSQSKAIINSDYYSISTGKVSQWDDLIKEYSVIIKWDWRLLASLICQESRFMPDVVSKAGAYGLMQIMPETGKNFGIDIKASPVNNIKAGIKYIDWLHGIFDPKIPDENERTKFILAAYNAGPGHILDAMKLAEKNGMDPLKWDGNVAEWLRKKSDPAYYTDSLVKNGYFVGKESIAFVNEVLARYRHYQNVIIEN